MGEDHAEEAAVVRLIFQLMGVDGCSLAEIGRRLRDCGIRTQTGRFAVWLSRTLWGILMNDAYTGTAYFNRRPPFFVVRDRGPIAASPSTLDGSDPSGPHPWPTKFPPRCPPWSTRPSPRPPESDWPRIVGETVGHRRASGTCFKGWSSAVDAGTPSADKRREPVRVEPTSTELWYGLDVRAVRPGAGVLDQSRCE